MKVKKMKETKEDPRLNIKFDKIIKKWLFLLIFIFMNLCLIKIWKDYWLK